MRINKWFYIVVLFLFFSCGNEKKSNHSNVPQRNFHRDLLDSVQKYELAGNDIIAISNSAYSNSAYFFIYADSNTFWLKHLDKKKQRLISANSDRIPVIGYWMSFDHDGSPCVKSDTLYTISFSPLIPQHFDLTLFISS